MSYFGMVIGHQGENFLNFWMNEHFEYRKNIVKFVRKKSGKTPHCIALRLKASLMSVSS